MLDRANDQLRMATEAKGDGGSGQDAWHDEGHKSGLVQEMIWSQRISEIEKILMNCQIVDPIEQAETVKLGNGVLVEYEDGSSFAFILEGYNLDVLDNRVSIHSPLGQAILNGRQGETRQMILGKQPKKITIQSIVAPSEADAFINGIVEKENQKVAEGMPVAENIQSENGGT